MISCYLYSFSYICNLFTLEPSFFYGINCKHFLLILGKPVGDTILYFGCRKKAEDFIYEEELNDYVKKDVLKVSKI